MNAQATKLSFKSTPVSTGDLPIGTIVPFAGVLDILTFQNQGWLYCNGNTVLRTDYPDLFQAIGSSYGAGDGKTTFALPDLRGTFLRGVSGTSGVDPDASTRTAAAAGGNAGNAVGSVQGYATGKPATALVTNTTGAHTHQVAHIPNDNSSYAVDGSYQAIWNDGANTDPAGDHTHLVNGGGDAESRPRNLYCYHLIKYAQV